MRDWLIKKRQADFDAKYKDSHRLVCDGVVIDQVAANLGNDFSIRMLGYFMQNIERALTNPNWVFDGKQSAAEWLKFQESRLGVKLTLNLRIVPPGGVLPLCPYLAKGPERICL